MKNVPDIIDVNILINLLKDLNVEVKIDSSTYTFKAENVNIEHLSSEEYKKREVA